MERKALLDAVQDLGVVSVGGPVLLRLGTFVNFWTGAGPDDAL